MIANPVHSEEKCSNLWDSIRNQYAADLKTVEWLYEEWLGQGKTCKGTGFYELRLAELKAETGRLREASTLIEETLVSYKGPYEAELDLANVVYSELVPAEINRASNAQWQRILERITSLMKKHKNASDVVKGLYYSRLSGVYYHLNDFENAFSYSNKAAKTNASEYILAILMKSAVWLGKNREAIYVLKEGMKQYPAFGDKIDVIMYGARAAVGNKDVDGALTLMHKAIYLNKNLVYDDFFRETYSNLQEVVGEKDKSKDYEVMERIMQKVGVAKKN